MKTKLFKKNLSIDEPTEKDTINPFKLGDWIIQPAHNELTKPKLTKTIESKAMDTLLYLKENHSQPVSNNELLENVWKDTVVGENTVRRIITQLRKALEDDVNQPLYIKTVPKRGYQLVAHVEACNQNKLVKPNQFISIGIALIIILSFSLLYFFGYISYNDRANKTIISELAQDKKLTQVTHLVGFEITPSLSPDGTSILFSHQPSEQTGPRIYWRDLNQLNNIPVKGINGKAISPVLAPDGQHVAYIDLSASECQIALAKVKQRGKLFESNRLIAPCDLNTFSRIAWKNNSEFYYRTASSSTEAKKVFLYNINNQERHPLSLYTEQPNIQLTHIASLARRKSNNAISNEVDYAYVVRNGFNSDLWIKRHHLNAEFHHQFKGNVRSIKFCGKKQSLTVMQANSLWQLDLGNNINGDKSKGIFTALPNNLSHLSCSANSNKLIFSARQLTSNISILNNPIYKPRFDPNDMSKKRISDPKHKYAIQPSSGSNRWPSFANQSNALAFVSNRNNDWEILISKNAELSKLSIREGIKLQGYPFIWSPDDSKGLVMQADQTLSVFDINNNHFETVATAKDNIFTLEWSHDGKGIYYVPLDTREINYLDLSSGSKKIISRIRTTDLMSVDKKTLYFTKSDEHGLWKLDIENNKSKLIIPSVHNFSQFRVFKEGIFFNKKIDKPSAIHYFNFKTKETTELFPEIETEYGDQFTISYDQSTIAFSKFDNYQADIYLLEFNQNGL